MSDTIRLTITFDIEFPCDKEFYDDGATLYECAEVEKHNATNNPAYYIIDMTNDPDVIVTTTVKNETVSD